MLAPEDVSAWMPTFRGHAYPLVVRAHYIQGMLAVFGDRVDREDLQARLILSAYVSGISTDQAGAEALLMLWLEQGRISVIAVPASFGRTHELEQIAGSAGLQSSEYLGYLIFYR